MILDQTEHFPLDPSSPEVPPKRRLFGPLVVILLVALTVGALPRVRIPYLALEAGPSEDAAKLTKISGQTYPSKGSFHITTALIRYPDGLLIPDALKIAVDPKKDLIRRELVYPSDATRKETDKKHADQMEESQNSAAIAALKELGYATEAGAEVRSITKGSKALDILRVGDVIVGVQGSPVKAVSDLTPLIRAHPIGARLTVSLLRDGSEIQATVETIESPEDKGQPVLGITVSQYRNMPFSIDIEADQIGGPSAGLVFALSVYDLLEPTDLTGGRIIAGTGTIDPTGRVGSVGAVTQKIRAAQKIHAKVFIVPKKDLAEARKAANGGIEVIGVSTLRQAIDLLSAR